MEELALAIASIETLVVVWAFIADQKVDLGRAVIIVASESSALRRWEESEIVLALLSEDGAERIGTGLEVTAAIIAVHCCQCLVCTGEERDKDGEHGTMHGDRSGKGSVDLFY